MLRRVFSVFLGITVLLGSWVGFGFPRPALAQAMLHQNLQQPYPLAEVLRNPVDEKLGEVGSKVE
jgi:photosystem II PsbU protein